MDIYIYIYIYTLNITMAKMKHTTYYVTGCNEGFIRQNRIRHTHHHAVHVPIHR